MPGRSPFDHRHFHLCCTLVTWRTFKTPARKDVHHYWYLLRCSQSLAGPLEGCSQPWLAGPAPGSALFGAVLQSRLFASLLNCSVLFSPQDCSACLPFSNPGRFCPYLCCKSLPHFPSPLLGAGLTFSGALSHARFLQLWIQPAPKPFPPPPAKLAGSPSFYYFGFTFLM